MLTIYRRHLAACKFRHLSRKHRNCQCPIWTAGVLHGRKIKQSLDLHSWEAVQKLVREWEAHPEGGAFTVKSAYEDYISDAIARNLSGSQMRKIRLILGELQKQYGSISLRQLTVDDLRKIREAWKVAPITMSKRLEMLRSFFRFCIDSGWLDKNPAKVVRLPVVEFQPTLPFTDEEMDSILWACDMVRDKHPNMDAGIEKRLKALVVGLLEKGVDVKTVSMLLGHTSIKTTEKHYAPWVRSRQIALEEAVKATFA